MSVTFNHDGGTLDTREEFTNWENLNFNTLYEDKTGKFFMRTNGWHRDDGNLILFFEPAARAQDIIMLLDKNVYAPRTVQFPVKLARSSIHIVIQGDA